MKVKADISELCCREVFAAGVGEIWTYFCANVGTRAEMCATLKGMAVPKCTAQTSQHRPVHQAKGSLQKEVSNCVGGIAFLAGLPTFFETLENPNGTLTYSRRKH